MDSFKKDILSSYLYNFKLNNLLGSIKKLAMIK